jgi:toxin ParE1/3/4
LPSGRKILWLRAALVNLDQAAAFIAKDNPRAAIAALSRIQAAVALLADFPHLGRPGRVESTRELVVDGTPFVVPYRVRGDVIEIIRVLHGAQRWPDLKAQ